MDRDQWQFAPYTEADLQSQIEPRRSSTARTAASVVNDVKGYVDGINAYIDEALADPSLLPAEYAALGKLPQPWTLTDSVAEASLIGGIFGKGGGRELDSALTMQAFVERFGRKAGRRAWLDFRSKNDPEAPTTVIGKRFPYQTDERLLQARARAARPGLGEPRPRGAAGPARAPRPRGGAEGFGEVGAQLRAALRGTGACLQLGAGRRARVRDRPPDRRPRPAGRLLPAADPDGDGPARARASTPAARPSPASASTSCWATAATTPGRRPRRPPTTSTPFAEVLCQDEFHYLYKGECLAMEKLERTNSWTPNGVDDTPPGSETLTAYRTVHGIVFARGKVDGKDVAFVIARSTYFHEADSALFFRRMNNPDFMKRRAAVVPAGGRRR